MPINPRGLTPGLVDRIRNQVRNIFAPSAPNAPNAPEPGAPQDPGFFSRIRDQAKSWLSKRREEAPPFQGPPAGLNDIMARIQWAGRQNPPRMLRMSYQSKDSPMPQWRNVEPYSYRYRAKEDPHIPLFFGYCHKDQGIEAYKLQRIADIQITDKPFAPKYEVEF